MSTLTLLFTCARRSHAYQEWVGWIIYSHITLSVWPHPLSAIWQFRTQFEYRNTCSCIYRSEWNTTTILTGYGWQIEMLSWTLRYPLMYDILIKYFKYFREMHTYKQKYVGPSGCDDCILVIHQPTELINDAVSHNQWIWRLVCCTYHNVVGCQNNIHCFLEKWNTLF